MRPQQPNGRAQRAHDTTSGNSAGIGRGGPAGSRTDAPTLRSAARFLRVTTSVTRLVEELNAGALTLDDSTCTRLTGMYGQFIDDLRGALSAHMYAELQRLVRVPPGDPGARELRLAYIELLGWLRGVPLEIEIDVPAVNYTASTAKRRVDRRRNSAAMKG
ncbi:MAG TPA: proteasome activator [Streptosporangiaceae bacterium]